MFQSLPLTGASMLDLSGDMWPTQVRALAGAPLDLPLGATHYGLIVSGRVRIRTVDWQGILVAGMYFSAPGRVHLDARDGRGLLLSRLNYSGLFQCGGPVNGPGRLRYIDGCTDTLLLSPPLRGDPCLNHLHLPSGVHQTEHTHPSQRLGVVLDGSGICRTPEGDSLLTAGMGWWIPTGQRHSFHTQMSTLDILAWHPDSDFGPTHDCHPMLNRTEVAGVRAAELASIRTR